MLATHITIYGSFGTIVMPVSKAHYTAARPGINCCQDHKDEN